MKLGLIGCGKMGGALAGGILASCRETVAEMMVFDLVEAASRDLSARHPNLEVASSVEALAQACDAIILAVKPLQIVPVIGETRRVGRPQVLISIAAGVTLDQLTDAAAPEQRLIRVMPNTPCLVGFGASGISRGPGAEDEDLRLVLDLFGSVGIAFEVPERLLDAVTGLSGSGPAYVYTMIEALSDAGVREGLPRDQALALATQTVLGGAAMVRETGLHPAVLREQVTSPGGTTIAALASLEENGFRAAVLGAVRAAAERSREMARPS